MAEPNQNRAQVKTTEQKWARHNAEMTALFAERDKWPVNSPEREAAALAILDRWVAGPARELIRASDKIPTSLQVQD